MSNIEETDNWPQHEVDTEYHRLLPIGKIFDGVGMIEHPSPSFESVQLLPLAPMLAPEYPRSGDDGNCWHCAPNDKWIWRDEHWHLTSMHTGMPFFGALSPNEHVFLDSAPEEILEALGGVLQRLSRAVKQIPGVARLHYGRFNDGGEHWHQQVVARPLGMMQARGAMSYLWEGELPVMPQEMWEKHSRIVAQALGADGGEALI